MLIDEVLEKLPFTQNKRSLQRWAQENDVSRVKLSSGRARYSFTDNDLEKFTKYSSTHNHKKKVEK